MTPLDAIADIGATPAPDELNLDTLGQAVGGVVFRSPPPPPAPPPGIIAILIG